VDIKAELLSNETLKKTFGVKKLLKDYPDTPEDKAFCALQDKMEKLLKEDPQNKEKILNVLRHHPRLANDALRKLLN